MRRSTTETAKQQRHTFSVDGQRFRLWESAAGRAVALAVQRREVVCIETVVGGEVIERLDVTAAPAID
jgi:hypothetical protein